MGDREVRERLKEMRVGEMIESDHMPLKVYVKEEGDKEWRRGVGRRDERGRWNEEGSKSFRERIDYDELGVEMKE